MQTEELLAYTRKQGYGNVRQLADGTIVGTHPLACTHALYVDLNQFSWGERYCYPTEAQAVEACNLLTTGDDAPKLGYVAKRIK